MLTMAVALLGAGTMLYAGGAPSTARTGAAVMALFGEHGAAVTHDIAYGPLDRHRLDVYEPEGGGSDGPVAVFLYGGGWTRGDKSYYAFVGRALARRGITTIIPDYRLYPDVQFPKFVEDAALAYAWTAKNIAAKGGVRRPITIAGHSAGAHSAALIALDPHYLRDLDPKIPRPAGLVGLAGPYSFDPTTWPSTKEIFSNVTNPDKARPAAFAVNGGPPALLMHGTSDTLVKMWNMHTLAATLKTAGTPVEMVELDGIGHIGIVSAIAWPLRWRAPVLERMAEFIDRRHEEAAARGPVSQPADPLLTP